jgi:hypothetical protein
MMRVMMHNLPAGKRGCLILVWIVALALLHAFSGPVPLRAAQDNSGTRGIKVPYGLAWGDGVDKVRGMLGAVKAREVSFAEKAPGKFVLEAEGLALADPLLKKSLFVFRDGLLVEVELQYADPGWDAVRAVDFFDRTRRRVDDRYGAGTLLVNQVKVAPPDPGAPRDMDYTLIIYRWNQPACSLELSFYAIEEKERSLRIVSLHYKTP